MPTGSTYMTISGVLAFLTVLLSANATSDSSDHPHDHANHHQHETMGKMHGHHSHNLHQNNHHEHTHHNSVVGEPALEKNASRRVAVTLMDSMRFDFPPHFQISPGEIITFEVTNQGKIPHEFSIGSVSEQAKHREMMKRMPPMKHEDGGSAITVEPGKTKKLTWKFTGIGEVEFACNIPGHYESGMKAKGVFKQN